MANIHSHFKKIPYTQLNGKQKELFNFQKIAATFADYGFNCIKLADDWQGADFLAYNAGDTSTLKVQLKSRLTINKKYCEKQLWMAFPYDGNWYVIEHDSLVRKVGEHTKWLDTSSWKDKGGYSSTSINPGLLESLIEDRLGQVYGHVLDTESSS
jgi:frataxin-like iron-binding protein CyaY